MLTRGQIVAAVLTGAVAVGGGATALVLANRPGPQAGISTPSSSTTSAGSPSPTASPAPKPRPVDPLTGRKVSSHPVVAAKIENIFAARPQVGIGAADIVAVEEVEGRLTRLIAVYHTTFPRRIGPVRSARNTDVELLPLFGKPGLIYSGANSRVQRNIDRASIVALPRSTRDPRRVAPHNVFVNVASVASSVKLPAAHSIGWTFANSDPRWKAAKTEKAPTARVGGDTFRFPYNGGRYTVRWKDQPYRDGDSGAVAKTDNIVVMAVRNHADGNADVTGAASVKSDTVGRGKVTIYRDGKRLTGTWQRARASATMRLRDGQGKDIPLAPGKTWLLLKG